MRRSQLLADRRRTRQLGVRLSAAEWRVIEALAAQAGVRPAAYVREAALHLACADGAGGGGRDRKAPREPQRGGVNLYQEAESALTAMGLTVSAEQEPAVTVPR